MFTGGINDGIDDGIEEGGGGSKKQTGNVHTHRDNNIIKKYIDAFYNDDFLHGYFDF